MEDTSSKKSKSKYADIGRVSNLSFSFFFFFFFFDLTNTYAYSHNERHTPNLANAVVFHYWKLRGYNTIRYDPRYLVPGLPPLLLDCIPGYQSAYNKGDTHDLCYGRSLVMGSTRGYSSFSLHQWWRNRRRFTAHNVTVPRLGRQVASMSWEPGNECLLLHLFRIA